jgi:spore germination protein GerM
MRLLRALGIVALLAVAAYAGYVFFARPPVTTTGQSITIYYTKTDGETVVPWQVSLGSAHDVRSIAFYAATQAVAGPPTDIDAIRFPAGTFVRSVDVNGSTATVDLNDKAAANGGGSFAESGEFKALVWTLTALPGIASVQVEVEGAKVATLPGGHFELDDPLTRQSW